MNETTKNGVRYKRMPIDSAVFMVRDGQSWTSDLVDISATGLLTLRPDDFAAKPGDPFILDIVINETLDIHVEAEVARITDTEIGFSFQRIPPEKEIPLWQILGRYADATESDHG